MVILEGRRPTLRIILVPESSLSSWMVYPLLRDPSSPPCRGCPRQAQYLRSAIWATLTKLDTNLESQHHSLETPSCPCLWLSRQSYSFRHQSIWTPICVYQSHRYYRCSVTKSRSPLWDPMDCSTPDFPVLHHLPEFAQAHVHWVSDPIQPSHPLSSPSIFPSIRVFSNELISFRIDWFDLLVVQGTLKSLLQHHSSKASILWHSGFFMVQLSHSYVTTGKTIALTKQTFFSKVMSLLFNMLSRFVIVFLPRSKHLLISWLQSSSAVILEPKKIKSVTVSTFSPSICHEVMGLDAKIYVFWMLSFKPLSPFTFIMRLFSFSSLCATRVVSSVDISPGNLDSSLWFI